VYQSGEWSSETLSDNILAGDHLWLRRRMPRQRNRHSTRSPRTDGRGVLQAPGRGTDGRHQERLPIFPQDTRSTPPLEQMEANIDVIANQMDELLDRGQDVPAVSVDVEESAVEVSGVSDLRRELERVTPLTRISSGRQQASRDPPARSTTNSKDGIILPPKRRQTKSKSKATSTRPPRHPVLTYSHSSTNSTNTRTSTSSSDTGATGYILMQEDREVLDISRPAPWNKASVLYVVLHYSFNLFEGFMDDILKQAFSISCTELFLRFFNDRRREFLLRIPLPLPEIMNYHTFWYICYVVTKYFTTEAHPGQQYGEYAAVYDQPPFFYDPRHLETVAEIGRYYNSTEKIAKLLYQDDFDTIMSRLNRSATLCESFDNFRSRPSPPKNSADWRQSPVVGTTTTHPPW
jgi:hypothetical protein